MSATHSIVGSAGLHPNAKHLHHSPVIKVVDDRRQVAREQLGQANPLTLRMLHAFTGK